MTPFNQSLLERRLASVEAFHREPSRFDRLFCRKCEVRALVVADGFLYFSDEDFGLSDFVSILESTVHASARVEVSKAHRNDPGEARLNGAEKNYRFSAESLANVDVVFMFAANRAGSLPPRELRALAEFMDAGGGVFATGDHEDLGQQMCGGLLRVRSMRKWFWPNQGPFGAPTAPKGDDETRHDTNRIGSDALWQFDDQSDDVPQPIAPKYYRVFSTLRATIREPHPLLCSAQGVIDVLPDHPHEGECITPWETTRTFSYDGASFEEFPTGAGGSQTLPDVIATSTMVTGAEAPPKPAVVGGSFGAISAYDGHRVGVGRVVCDATWHHFINVNLTGTAERPVGHPKRVGFLASDEGEAAFEKIKAYFRNIVLWSAPPSKQTCMRNRRYWNLVRHPWLREQLRLRTAGTARYQDLIVIGRLARLFAVVDASRCQTRSWHFDLFLERLLPFPELHCIFRPCVPELPPRPGPEPFPFLDGERLGDAFLGGAVLALLEKSAALEETSGGQPPQDPELGRLIDAGVGNAFAAVQVEFQREAKQFAGLAEKLQLDGDACSEPGAPG